MCFPREDLLSSPTPPSVHPCTPKPTHHWISCNRLTGGACVLTLNLGHGGLWRLQSVQGGCEGPRDHGGWGLLHLLHKLSGLSVSPCVCLSLPLCLCGTYICTCVSVCACLRLSPREHGPGRRAQSLVLLRLPSPKTLWRAPEPTVPRPPYQPQLLVSSQLRWEASGDAASATPWCRPTECGRTARDWEPESTGV